MQLKFDDRDYLSESGNCGEQGSIYSLHFEQPTIKKIDFQSRQKTFVTQFYFKLYGLTSKRLYILWEAIQYSILIPNIDKNIGT